MLNRNLIGEIEDVVQTLISCLRVADLEFNRTDLPETESWDDRLEQASIASQDLAGDLGMDKRLETVIAALNAIRKYDINR